MASSVTIGQISDRRRKAETGLHPFLVAYFTRNEPLLMPICSFHRELCAELDRALLPKMHFRGAFAREHGKSTIGTKGVGVFAAASGKKKFILIIGANQKEAEAKLDNILDALKWPEIVADYGPEVLPAVDMRKNRDEKNSAAEVRLANGCYLVAAEAMGKLRGKLTRGKRPDLVILDDPEDDEQCRNPDWRKRFREVFIKKVLLNSMDSELGSSIWLGTLLNDDSPLHHEIFPRDPRMRANIFVHRLTYNAHDPKQRVAEDNETPDPNGVPKVLWPQRWSFKKQMERRELIGPRAFNQEFMNDPRDPDNMTFQPAGWAYYDRNLLGKKDQRWGVRLQRGSELTLFDKIAVSCDPAFTQDAGDFTAVIAIGIIDELERRYIIGLHRARVNTTGVVSMLTEFVETYGPDLSSIEMIALQDVLLKDEIIEKVPAKVQKIRSTTKKEIRIEGSSPLYESRKVYVPDPADYPIIKDFIAEAEQFPNGANDDMLDVSAQCLTLLRTRGKKHKVGTSGRRRTLAGYTGGY